MSVNFFINEVPDALANRLRARAQRNHRSLQGELLAIVEDAACEPKAMRADSQRCLPARPADRADLRKAIEQIAAKHRVPYPEPLSQWPLAVDIVREVCDAR